MRRIHENMRMRDISQWGDNDILDITTVEDENGLPIYIKYIYEQVIIQSYYPSGKIKVLEEHTNSYDARIEYDEDGNIVKYILSETIGSKIEMRPANEQPN